MSKQLTIVQTRNGFIAYDSKTPPDGMPINAVDIWSFTEMERYAGNSLLRFVEDYFKAPIEEPKP